jgi:hypothetical protein
MQKTSAVTVKKLRIFSLILTMCFFIVGIGIPYLKGRHFNVILSYIAFSFFILGIFTPTLLSYPHKYWMSLGNILGKINNTIFFTIIYLILFATVGLIFRILKRDRLKKKFRMISSTIVLKSEISSFNEPF